MAGEDTGLAAAARSLVLPGLASPSPCVSGGPWALVPSKIPPRSPNGKSLPPRAGIFSVQKRVALELSIRKDLGDRSA